MSLDLNIRNIRVLNQFSTRLLGFGLYAVRRRGAALQLLPGWKQGYSGENVAKIRQLCLVSLLLTSGVANAANVRLQVEGLSGTLEKNVRAQLSTIESDEVTPDRRFRARVDDAIRDGLKALGYYEPTIDFDLRPPPAKGRQVLIARV